MKTFHNHFEIVIMLLIAILLFHNCNDKSLELTGKGEVSFAFDMPSTNDNRTLNDNTPYQIHVKFSSSEGTSTEQSITLHSFGDQYISESIALEKGVYTLDEFLVLNSSNEVIYATPLEGSDYAEVVERALPIPFSISTGNVTNISPEVVSTTSLSAEDLGYASFSFEIVNTFLLYVAGLEEEGIVPLNTTVHMLHNEDTLSAIQVNEQVTPVKLFDYDSVTLIIEAPAYFRFEQTISTDSLSQYTTAPFSIYLEPAITFIYGVNNPIDFSINVSTHSSFIINYGSKYRYDTLIGSGLLEFGYEMESDVDTYFVSIKGDLNNIIYIRDTYAAILHMDIHRLKNLRNISLMVVEQDSIDLSFHPYLEGAGFNLSGIKYLNINQNPLLKGIFFRTYGMETLDISKNLLLTSVNIGSDKLKTLDIRKHTKLRTVCVNNDRLNFDGFEKLYFSDDNIIETLDLGFCRLSQTEVDSVYYKMYQSLKKNPRAYMTGLIYTFQSATPSETGKAYADSITMNYCWEIIY